MKKIFIDPRQKIYSFSIFEPLRIFFGKKISEQDLKLLFSKKFNFKNILTVSQGRIGIYLAVKSIINESKTEIIMSPFTVFDVVNMVICAGGKPVYADIDFPSMSISPEEINKKINSKTAGIIITHYQGFCEKSSEIYTLAAKQKIKIIEDCAIVFGTKIGDKYVGVKADIAIYSFNITKFISTLSGGLLICNDENIFQKINTYAGEFKINPFIYLLRKYIKALQIKIFTSTFVFNLITRWIIKFTLNSNIKRFKNLVRSDPDPKLVKTLPKYYNSFVSNYQRRDIYIKVESYLKKQDQKTRLENYLFYQSNLQSISQITIHKLNNNTMHGAVSFPIFYFQRDILYKHLISNGCDVSKYFYRDCSSLKIFEEFYYSCKNSNRACNEVILLPVYPSYSMKSIEKNIQIIKNFFIDQNLN